MRFKPMDTPKERLDDLRQKIDAIDEKIIQLLTQRTLLVEEVGQRKTRSSKGSSFIRPGREATMIRKLVAEMEGNFPKTAVISIWRQIIAASLSIEQPMSIAAFSTTVNNACMWLAREYFGTFSPLTTYDDVLQVVYQVMAGKVAAGVIPYSALFSGQSPWWLDTEGLKANAAHPRVFAAIPFFGNPPVQAVAIANVMPEPTGDDTSLLAVTIDAKTSLEHLVGILKNSGLTVGKNFWRSDVKEGVWHFLLEIEGFITAETPALKESCHELIDSNIKINILGSYANPIKI